jgi:hypothetical protein
MSIKITKGDFTIEVDTDSELKTVFQALGIQRQTVSLKPSDFVVDTNALVKVYKSISVYSKSYKALHLLKERPNGLTKEELIEELELKSSQALGGVFGGIGRNANKFGVNTDDIYNWEFINNVETYRLTENMKKAMSENVE